jgi:hypothetical protein
MGSGGRRSMMPQSWGAWPHPASTAVAVELAKPTRQILRQYGTPAVVVALAAVGKLGWDRYQTHVETHELNKPWAGKLIKVNTDQTAAACLTATGSMLEGVRVVGTLPFELTA